MADFTGTAGPDTLTGTENADTISGLGGDDILNGADGSDDIDGGDDNDLIDGGPGIDQMSGGAGDDTFFIDQLGDVVLENAGEGTDLVFTSVSYGLGANVERGAVTDPTSTSAITINGNVLDNEIWGNNGANYLNGDVGVDILRGLGGNDVFIVDNSADVVIESAGGGTDIVYTTANYVLSDHVERLAVNGYSTTFAVNLTGNALNNELIGNNGSNLLDGGPGADLMQGNGGDDYYVVTLQGTTSIGLLPGLPGLGRVYLNVSTADGVVEHAGGGLDTIWVTYSGSPDFHLYFDYTIRERGFTPLHEAYIERLGAYDFTSTYAVNFEGNNLNNEIWGNDGQNVLDGLGGTDILRGHGGDDIYFLGAGDIAVEYAGDGIDLVYANFSTLVYFLPDHIERAFSSAPQIIGNAFDNEMWGSSNNNELDGREGADIMKGLAGNDVYVVDNAGDVVIEFAPGTRPTASSLSPDWGGGNDLIWTSVDYVLPTHVERMGVNGFATTFAINLTGNAGGNEMWGNDGVNVIDGLAGADVLHGNGGADTFAFTTALGSGNIDQLVDFQQGTDKIALDDAVFTGLAPGALPAGAFVTGSAAQDADDRIIYDTTTGALYFDADGNGTGSSAVQFASVLNNGRPIDLLSASDFVVI